MMSRVCMGRNGNCSSSSSSIDVVVVGRLLLLSFFFLCFLCCSSAAAARSPCPEVESEVLLDFKKSSIDVDSNNVLGDWGKGDCCEWAGVKCHPETGNVVELVLNPGKGAYFSGEAALSKLQLLPELRVLDLSHGRNLTGSIPAILGQVLTKLETLNLKKNKFTGPIPASLTYLHQLSYLDLSENELSSDIPDLIDTKLKYLDLSGNQLTEDIPDMIGSLSSLTVLRLSRNGFTGGFPDFCLKLDKLAILSVDHNQLSGSLPKKIGKLNGLKSLVLSHNKFEGEIPESLGDLKLVSTLLLDNNDFRGEIPSTFGRFEKLVSFNVSNNHLSGPIPQVAPINEFPKDAFAGNDGLCGHPLPECSKLRTFVE